MASRGTLAVIIAVIVIVLAGAALYFQSEYNFIGVNDGAMVEEESPSPKPAIEVISQSSQKQVRVGRTDTIIVSLPSQSAKKPTAIDLTFEFDNELVEVTNIVPGKLWNTSNVLKKVINNEAGTVRLAAGQGFNAKVTDNLELIEIEYRVLGTGNIVFELTDASIFAYVGDNQVTPVTSSQVVIQGVN